MWFVFFVIVSCIVAKTLQLNCQIDADCSGSMCLKNRCMYRSRFRRQINFGVRMLGEECQSNDECRRTPVDGTKICRLNQCQCSTSHVPIDSYRCIRDFEHLPSNVRVTKVAHIDEQPGYGSMCSANDDCQHSTIQLECLHGTCVCLDGYVPLGKYLCYNIRAQEAPIIETTTITPDQIHHPMVKSIGSACTDDYYCRQSISQSHCYNGQCSCLEGYRSTDLYTCLEDAKRELISYKSLLGGQCLTKEDCQSTDVLCLNQICTCPKNSFPIDEWNCLPESDLPTASFIKTTTIIPFPSTTSAFLWWPWTSSTAVQPLNTFRFRCSLDWQCLSMDRNAHCTSSGRCVCSAGYRLELLNKEPKCHHVSRNERENHD